MSRMAAMIVVFITPICCCLGAALQEDVSDFVVQAPVRERAMDFIFLTPLPTPTPEGGTTGGGSDNGNDGGGVPERGVSENDESAGDETDEAGSSAPPQASPPGPPPEPAITPLTPPTLIPTRPANATPIPTLESTPVPTAASSGPPPPGGGGGGSGDDGDNGDDDDDDDDEGESPTNGDPGPTTSSTPPSTASSTSVATSNPTPSPTLTMTLTSTPSPTLTVTSTFTPSPTLTATLTPSPTITPTSTPTLTVTPIVTPAESVLGFNPTAYSVVEGQGPAVITVTLDKSSSQTVTVAYASSDETATAGDDYTSVADVLTFNPGQTSQSFTVPILADSLTEPGETLLLTLSSPVSASLGALSVARLTIIDDDQPPVVQFEQANYSVAENNGPAVINVALTAPSASTVTVDYTTADITAAAGQDYTPVTGVLTFEPGQTSQPINLSLINDPDIECSEDLRLTLTNPTQATLGALTTATLTLINDDFQPALTDDNETNCNCTLREAIITANTNTPVDACPAGMTHTITLTAGTYQLSLAGANEEAAATGDLDITEELTLTGTGATIIDAGGLNDRVFHILTGSVTLSQVEIANGSAPDGGGIFNEADLTLANSLIRNNQAQRDGGGIFNNGALTLVNSAVSNNTAADNGGAISTNGDVTISRSTLSFNRATAKSGGAILANTGAISITASTISQNTAGQFGGGLATTASGKPPVSIIDSTIFENSALNNGGGGVRDFSGTVTFRNTMIAGSLNGGDCKGSVVSLDYNLDSDGSCISESNDKSAIPLLGPLQDNGGPTETHALLSGSPALDAGSCPDSVVDQRGFDRPVDQLTIPNVANGCDIGAYELPPQ